MLPGSFLDLFLACKIKNSDRLLIAASGGIDSAVLIDLCKRESIDFAVAHANFQLRGEDSDKDELFVEKLALSSKARFFSQRFETKSYAEEKKISIQMAARELRYNWMFDILEAEGFKYLVTAHHLNDALETTLINLARGTGIAGLRGMKPLQGKIFRPLLYTSRKVIEDYARLNNVQWREDVSNATDHYRRNYIRHHVVPELEKLNPSVAETYKFTHMRLVDTESVLLQAVRARINLHQHEEGGDIYINREAFSDQNIAITEELLAPYGVSGSQVLDLLGCISENTHSQIFLTADYSLNLDREYLIISKVGTAMQPLPLKLADASYSHPMGRIQTSIEPGSEPVLKEAMEASFDYDKLQEPLIFRKWEQGDRFMPMGMQGKKKVSDLMIDEKIPLNLKQRVCVLESGGEIIWVVGLRISEVAKVTNDTTRRFNIIIDNDKSV